VTTRDSQGKQTEIMPITLDDLKRRIDPRRTVLLLGAGASVPSGAELAKRLWEKIAQSDPQSEDLIETASPHFSQS
jgi:hypothetical protein